MTACLSPPDSHRSYAISADWLELLSLCRASGLATGQDLNDSVIFDPAEEDNQENHDDIDLDILNPASEAELDAVFSEIGFRSECLGSRYPFSVTIGERTIRLERRPALADEGIARARDIYVSCLLISCVRFGLIDGAKAGIPVDPTLGNIFQILATVAAAGYVGGDAYLFGHPRPDQTPMIEATKKLSALLKSGTALPSRPDAMPIFAKDGGIDVVAWREHIDGRPSKIVLFGQCAAGRNWTDKPIEPDVRQFKRYFSSFVSEYWLPALFVPFPIYADKENTHNLDRDTDRHAFYSVQESKFGIVVDRLRMVHWASDVWQNLLPTASEAIQNVSDVWEWRDQALSAAKAAAAAA